MTIKIHIRFDRLRQVVRTAIDAGFDLDDRRSHPALVCPVCGHREIFTGTGRQVEHEIKSKISRLRKHGMPWQDQPGIHTAPLIGRQR